MAEDIEYFVRPLLFGVSSFDIFLLFHNPFCNWVAWFILFLLDTKPLSDVELAKIFSILWAAVSSWLTIFFVEQHLSLMRSHLLVVDLIPVLCATKVLFRKPWTIPMCQSIPPFSSGSFEILILNWGTWSIRSLALYPVRDENLVLVFYMGSPAPSSEDAVFSSMYTCWHLYQRSGNWSCQHTCLCPMFYYCSVCLCPMFYCSLCVGVPCSIDLYVCSAAITMLFLL